MMIFRPMIFTGLALLLVSFTASCSSKPKPTPTVSPFVTKPINKAKDTQTNFEKTGKQHENLDPEKQTGQ
jgi:hypothetical protein